VQIASDAPVAVCTLWEGDYHKGLAALANSLVRAGFHGRIWAGYRGLLPAWVSGASPVANTLVFKLTAETEINFVRLDTSMHFALYKPTWCRTVMEERDPDASGIFYFDPDILVLADWSFFAEWLNAGIAVCEDSHFPLNPGHPRWRQSKAYVQNHNFTTRREADAYLNSGIVGVRREYLSFLRDWEALLELLRQDFRLGPQMRGTARTQPFFIFDQDAFTVVSCITTHPVARVGPDGMSFSQGEWLTLHATEGAKPWRRRVLWDLLRYGIPPDRALRLYWEFAAGPGRAETVFGIQSHRITIPLAAFLSRFYHRP
jgi:hypothetical protein